ncbi:MAG: hypothetical protein HXS52_05010 [Theionarchaea archaeon]|nr:hypothetical protein [Theionarchaea archaeon]
MDWVPIEDMGDSTRRDSSGSESHEGWTPLKRKYDVLFAQELDLGRYLTYKANQKIPFLKLFRFEEAFSFSLVSKLLHRLKATRKDFVLDPFCGSGITLFTCFCSQIPSVGIDRLPVAWFVSKTLPLFLFLKPGDISCLWNTVKSSIDDTLPASIAADVPVMKAGFTEDNLLILRKMKTAIDNLEDPSNDIFLFLFFSILEECSLTTKEHSYPVVQPEKEAQNPVQAMERKVNVVEQAVSQNSFLDVSRAYMPEVFLLDARDLAAPLKRPPHYSHHFSPLP